MIEFKHVLCPTDLSEASTRALTYAAAIAKWYNATLTLLSVVPTFDPMPVRSGELGGPVQVVYPVSQDDVLAELRRIADAAGVDASLATLAAEAGDPSRVIVDRAAAGSADLIVVGTHGRSGFERLMIGSVAEKVLRRAPCPVMVVPPHAPAALPAEVRFHRVLCPMDFSPAALQALGFALDLARQADGRVTLVHAIEWLVEEESRQLAHFNVPEARRQLIDMTQDRLKALVADESRTWSAIDEQVVVGRAHREILRVAADVGPDLIVMGTQGRGGLGLALFGSTTHEVVRAAPCPVLTVHGVRSEGQGPQAD